MAAGADETGAAERAAGPGEGDGYEGPATLTIGGSQFTVEVHLRGHFQPIDGRYHWYGRTAAHDALTAALKSGRAPALLTTPEGSAPCELSDPDPWQRYSVTGISTPPFAAELSAGSGSFEARLPARWTGPSAAAGPADPGGQTVPMAENGGGVSPKGVPRADREQQILDAAVAGFGERGYAHASMAAIAQRAGISKPLIYEYFGSKDGLYLACLNRAGTHLVDRVASAQNGTTLARATDTLAAIFSALDGRRPDWAVINDPTLPAGSAVRDAALSYRARLQQLAAEGTREVLGGYGLTDPGDNALTSHVWVTVVTATVNWWLSHPDETEGAGPDLLERDKEFIATTLTAVIGDVLRVFGLDSGAAEPWGFGITGLVQSTGEWWLQRRSMSRGHVVEYVTQLIWAALSGLLREAGIALDPDQPVPAARPGLVR